MEEGKGKDEPASFVSYFQAGDDEGSSRETSETMRRSRKDSSGGRGGGQQNISRRGTEEKRVRCFSRTAPGLVRTRRASEELPMRL